LPSKYVREETAQYMIEDEDEDEDDDEEESNPDGHGR
jgi:hypothetical protein